MMSGKCSINEIISIESLKNVITEIQVKYEFGGNGRLLIIGGGKESSNPLVFAGWAATYSGIDTLYVMTPNRIANIVSLKLSWATVIELPDMKITRGVANKILRSIKRRLIKVDTVLIGPGLKGIGREINRLIDELEKMNLNIVTTSGAFYEDFSRLLNYANSLVVAKEGELNIIFNKENTLKSSENQAQTLTKFSQKYASTLMVFSSDKIEIYSEGKHYIIPNYKKVPLKFGALYLLSGLSAGLYSLIGKPLQASILSSLILMKTCENAFENFGLHYTIENLSSIMQDTAVKYLRDIEKI
jgi:NAD(P)H-hydrate repair Nnr-like enzyme with NAD(P)H-hydrate dehydratase domain